MQEPLILSLTSLPVVFVIQVCYKSFALRFPCVAVRVMDNGLVAGAFQSGHVRLFTIDSLDLAVEICAHSQPITAMDTSGHRVRDSPELAVEKVLHSRKYFPKRQLQKKKREREQQLQQQQQHPLQDVFTCTRNTESPGYGRTFNIFSLGNHTNQTHSIG